MEQLQKAMGSSRTSPDSEAFTIAHINFTVDRSVDLKLERMAAAARALHLPIDFIVFSALSIPREMDNLKIRKLPGSGLGRALAAKIQWPFRLIWAAQNMSHTNYDVIILRYPKLPFGWQWFLRRVGVPVITEHHTDELAEIRNLGGWAGRLGVLVESRLRGGFLNKVSGVVGVTDEIVKRICLQAPLVPSAVMSNGADVDSLSPTGFRPFDGKVLRLVSVASAYATWQGIDRLLCGMLAYQGSLPIKVVVIGSIPKELKELVDRVNQRPGMVVDCPGPLYGEALDQQLGDANLAIASLALFRKRMHEGCPLKTREYMARGIPFVYGYEEDPDFQDADEFALKVPADESPISMEALIQFAASLSRLPDLARQMRMQARERIDWKIKMQAMYSFARMVVESEVKTVPPQHESGRP